MTTAARRTGAWMAIAVALVAIIPFLPSLQNGFVSWDDDKNFLANTAYRGLGWQQLTWMWTTFHLGHYVPLSWMTLGLDYSLWGMDARGYHLTSLVIHAANAAVLYLVARRLLTLAVSAYGFSFYLWKTFVPTGLAAYYPLPTDVRPGAMVFLPAYLTVVAFAGLGWRAWLRSPVACSSRYGADSACSPQWSASRSSPSSACSRGVRQSSGTTRTRSGPASSKSPTLDPNDPDTRANLERVRLELQRTAPGRGPTARVP